MSTNANGYQIVAVGKAIYYSKNWEFFVDFLFDNIKQHLGNDWWNSEISKPLDERHPILQWYDSCCRLHQDHQKRQDGAYVATLTGAFTCYLGLAYNLYLLKHNVELQARLINRLKNLAQFQGAYYELIVANCLIRAGFALALEDESDDSSKHCEFSAVSDHTGKKYWVEAKMRSVSGFLGKTAVDGAHLSAKPTSRLAAHLREALAKPASGERLVFIDLNVPPFKQGDSPAEQGQIPPWFEAAAQQLDDRERDLKEGQQAYVFVTNMPFHWDLAGEASGHGVLAHGLGIADFGKPGHFRLSEVWRQKQRHVDAHHIINALRSYPSIPATFDGSLPLSQSEAENRIEIGRTYFFPDMGEKGMIGRVTTATILENQRKVYIGIMSEDGQGRVLTREITDEELRMYKRHSDAYFGVVKKAPKKISDPYDLFEFMMEKYRETPKEQLLELCEGAADFESLKELNQTDLALELCERWTASTMERRV